MINTSAFDRVLYLNLTQDNTLSLAELEEHEALLWLPRILLLCYSTLFICFNCQFLSHVMFPISGSFGSDVDVYVVGGGRS